MIILGIESSCDETAAAILEDDILKSNVVVSQIDIFKAYGGVIPEVAARSHLEAIMPVIHQAFEDAGFKRNDWSKIDAIAVTHTPGLLGSLLVGTLTARTLAILHNKPLYAVHHLKSHIYANWLNVAQDAGGALAGPASADDLLFGSTVGGPRRQDPHLAPTFPLLALVISGGHTQIIHMTKHNHFEIIGTTYDDAVGECFDKVAKILGLPYPGGPSISKAALGEITKADTSETVKTTPGDRQKYRFPHPKLENPLDFSFSGLKTAFLRTVQKIANVPISHPSSDLKNLLTTQQIADLAASFEQTAVDILLEKMQTALDLYPDTKSIVFAGGVSANKLLREEALNKFSVSNPVHEENLLTCFFPAPKFSGDNAAMVAAAAHYEIASAVEPTDPYSLNILPRSVIN